MKLKRFNELNENMKDDDFKENYRRVIAGLTHGLLVIDEYEGGYLITTSDEETDFTILVMPYDETEELWYMRIGNLEHEIDDEQLEELEDIYDSYEFYYEDGTSYAEENDKLSAKDMEIVNRFYNSKEGQRIKLKSE